MQSAVPVTWRALVGEPRSVAAIELFFPSIPQLWTAERSCVHCLMFPVLIMPFAGQVGEILCDLNPPGGQTQPPKPTEEPALVAAHKATISETASTADAASTHAPGGSDGASRHKASASPAVRALAKEYGLDLGNVVRLHPCFEATQSVT